MNKKVKSWLLLILLSIIWGSSFILMKKSMFDEHDNILLSASQVAALRIFIAAIVILPFTFNSLKLILTKDWIYFLLVGLIGNLVPAFLFTLAQEDLSSSFTGILNSLVPIFSIIVSYFVFKINISKLSVLGIIIGFIGTILLTVFYKSDFSKLNYYAVLMVVSATICYAFSLNIIKEKLSHVNAIDITSISLQFMIIPSLYFILREDTIEKLINPTYTSAFIYTAILAILGTTIALVVFNNLIKNSTAVFASSVTYLIPFVALIWGVIFGEQISWSVIFILVIIWGIFLVKKGNKVIK